MKVEGSHTIPAPRERVWELLNDPDVLARCTPGVSKMEAEREGFYRATLQLSIGPVKGRFEGHMEVTDSREPEAMTLTIEGSGAPGGVRAVGHITLEQEGEQTVVSYHGQPQISGRLAAVGARLLSGVAKKLAGQFFNRLSEES
ncbi:MAG: carbon monoxide dehydrogenase subunit G [Trueperaceae bacterium]|nr:carbon monoxide dehydrogenase [Anaerolineae bacterium]UCH26053.1 MAG: carbon monoxide dehydrogenase subunit G [Trueperaceae bacterium]